MKRYVIPLAALAFLMLSHLSFGADLQENYTALQAVSIDIYNHPASERTKIITDAYNKLFLGSIEGDLSSLTDEELDLALRACNMIVGHTLNPSHAKQMKAVYDELKKRSALTASQKRAMIEVLVMIRRMDEARRLSSESRDLEINLPETKGLDSYAGVPTVWVASESDESLIRKPVDLAVSRIIVVSHPQCSFSENALKQIMDDTQLSEIFSKQSLWVIPQTAALDVEMLLGWKKSHTGFDMAYVYDQHEWPTLDEWGTPIFYFMKDNKVVYKVVGWPASGRKAMLLEGLAKIK